MISLLKKDFRVIRFRFYGVLVAILLINFLSYFATNNHIGLSQLPLLLCIVYIPLFVWASLHTESTQLHQWLHSPASAWKLLCSKVTIAILTFILVFALSVSILIGLYSMGDGSMDISPPNSTLLIYLIGLLFLLMTLSIVSLICLLWTIYHWLRRFTEKWAWVITTLLLFLYIRLIGFLPKTFMFIDFVQLRKTNSLTNENLEAFVGNLLLNLLIIAIQLVAACWILDRKVEV
ncbi:hypothetical protein SAMN05444487_105168 [Marininema mesophilum]|uniref:ABC-2 family transporter protein n=1 Tax=Marininema mesophilum TaxID=1048340 RepID=A0A1H2VP77_9BACL|nr:hypothetical protein [Marininema mesophilum]SDW70172.1 hypothetical protein SAMN05444487_105168 [Marininema mesophilum]